jgi:plasmid stabilization system protein ParE
MKRFQLSTQAANDIRDIWAYIAADSLVAARKVRLSCLNACQTLANRPGLGHTRLDLTDQPVRFWPVGSYVIIYDPKTDPLAIIRVLHGARNISNLI